MKASDVFVKALENEGVKYVFGVPGEENLHLLDSIRKSSIKFILTRHEQAAGFMAATVGRLTGIPGVCLSTLGPGATNLVTAVAYAQLGAMPAIFITGQKPIKKNKQGHFQIVNTVEMMKPITKITKQIVSADLIPAVIRESFKLSADERPGAAHIELPEDIAKDEILNPNFFEVLSPRRPIAEEKAILKAVALIENSKRPLILVGAGANRKRVSKMLTLLINKTGIPFFTTQMGKGVVSERHPKYLGTAAFSANDAIHGAIENSDLIINVGHDIIEKPPFLMNLDSNKNVVHINFSPAIPDMVYSPKLEVIGDIANAIWQISEKIKIQKKWDLKYFENFKLDIENKEIVFSKPDNLCNPLSVIQEIRSILNDTDILTLDNGMYKLWFARHYKTYSENTLLLDNALATMGAGLPSAIAAKLIYPKNKVVTVVGDGGFMMNSQEIETAMRLKLDLAVIVLRDDAYGMIKWKQELEKQEKYGLSFSNPDIVKYAESFGARGHRINKKGDLVLLLKQSFKDGGVHIIDLPIDYSDNKNILLK